jgi:hypothetical protein
MYLAFELFALALALAEASSELTYQAAWLSVILFGRSVLFCI